MRQLQKAKRAVYSPKALFAPASFHDRDIEGKASRRSYTWRASCVVHHVIARAFCEVLFSY
jgi:hypothetical protein